MIVFTVHTYNIGTYILYSRVAFEHFFNFIFSCISVLCTKKMILQNYEVISGTFSGSSKDLKI